MSQAKSYAAFSADKPLAPFTFDRREPRPDDVAIEILYCGVCHSDLHFARNDWGMSQYCCAGPRNCWPCHCRGQRREPF